MNPNDSAKLSTQLLDDEMIFLEEDDVESSSIPDLKSSATSQSHSNPEIQDKGWKILIVDDDTQVHQTTKMVLKGFNFQDKPVTLLAAYSGKEAQEVIKAHPDIALILLDVVMESDDAGLQVVKYVREILNNHFVRIILRTGQPGEVPEESIIVNYDINDYTVKTELTYQRLITIVISALRSYIGVIKIAKKSEELEKVITKLQASEVERKRAQEECDRFFNLSADMLGTASFDGYFKLVNPAFENILGYTNQEIMAKPFIEFVHPDDQEATIAEATKLGLGGETIRFENRYRCKDGSYSWLSWICKSNVEEKLIYANARDITERKISEQQFQTQYKVTQILAESTNLEDAIPEILKSICQNLDWELGEFWGIDTQANVLRCHHSWPKSPMQLGDFISITQDYSFASGVGLPGRVWMTGKAAWIVDVLEDSNFLRYDSAAKAGLHTAFGFPVFTEDNHISGVIVFFASRIQQPDEKLLTLMLNIGSQIGQFIVRKQAKAALAESEALFRSIIENANDLFFIINSQGEFTYVSPQFTYLLGYELDELKNKPFMVLIHPDDLHICIEAANNIFTNGEKQSGVEYRVIYKDGNLRYHVSNISPLLDKQGKITALMGIGRDVSDQKMAEKALQKFALQLQQQAEREKILNRITSQIRSSLDFNAILTPTLEKIRDFLQIDLSNFAWYLDNGLESYWETISESRYPHLTSTIGRYPTEIIGTLIKKLLDLEIIRCDDIDEIKHVEGPQFAYSKEFKSVLSIPLQIRPGLIGAVSCCSQQIRHWRDDEVELLEAVMEQLVIALNQTELYNQTQTKAQELEQAFNKLQHTQAQLIQSEKMSSLGKMVAGIAHEINNPVTFIHGNLAYAESYVKDILKLLHIYQCYYPTVEQAIQTQIEEIDLNFLIEDLSKLFESMKTGTARIREIVLSLRVFSRLDEAEYKTVDIHEGIESSLVILDHRLKSSDKHPAITIHKNYRQLPQVDCFAGHLNQVFLNILNNAIDAFEEIFNQNQSSNLTIWVETEKVDDNHIAIRIRDNGIGISPSIKPRIFDPFFTTKPVGQGTGMGLATSYQIITEKHGGKLDCNSTLGEGTEFIITIPVCQPEMAQI
jgi:two-component system, NtrC family, sensor kinase